MIPARRPAYSIGGMAATGRLQSLTITDRRDTTADELTLTLEDHDGRLAIPPRGKVLSVALGWEGEALVDRGLFTVDEVEHSGAPDVLTIRARSANLRKSNPAKRCESYHKKTLQQVVGSAAGRLGLGATVAPSLAGVFIDHIDQTDESDLHFLNRLAERYDALCMAKNGQLLFMPMNGGVTAGGTAIPSITLKRGVGDTHRYLIADREEFTGVIAFWSDLDEAERKEILVGSSENAKRLRHTYATEGDAIQAASAELKRLQRKHAEFTLELAEGRADIYPETPVIAEGYKPEIDATPWIIDEVTHQFTNSGYTCEIKMQTR
jgi:hypothetical protein